jgi:hypothetical protein
LAGLPDQHLDVLDGTGKIILDPHSPEPAPARPVESIALGSSKGAFHQVPPGLEIAPRWGGASRFPHAIQIRLSEVAFDRSAGTVLGALLS